ncbi:UDP-N-acetylmuramoyl-L-alanine--D-glutamate ligase [Persicobacter psychrovividus]|uniref:UDP-N-acetylmuramoylalanine--D-glutamate ligase n=1 Tax=Persicobacter psychrovividus TaxID=387638 RepID=A0ABM7VEQ8_9BACT|nr:UDP-N-acetylmuramoylalanine--D-glutamate ligase [Persicobacter psychrovividus]
MKKLVVLGGGESGVGAALLGKAKGYEVFLSDLSKITQERKDALTAAGVNYEETQHSEAKILAADVVVKSPGIPDTAPLIQQLVAKEIQVISELEFAFQFTKARFLAITGTNGKTTTTMLTYHLLKSAGYKVGLAGNVGYSLAQQVIADEFDWYVLEVSSFQLDGMCRFKADAAVITNITPDHLDRYDHKMKNYIASKMRIAQNMTVDHPLIVLKEDEAIAEGLQKGKVEANLKTFSLSSRNASAFVETDRMVIPSANFEFELDELTIQGPHNVQNAMAAVLLAQHAGLNKSEIRQGLKSFVAVAHRLEFVANINGVAYYNDSKATNVDAVKYALDSFKQPIVWVAGGKDKGNDYQLIASLVEQHVKALVCLGADNQPLLDFFSDKLPVFDTNNLEDCILKVQQLADNGDVVLLSPACASFDLFDNYEHRGDCFRQAVLAMENKV